MLALDQYESEVCGCGLHKSVADKDPDLEMTERRCPVCAALAKNERIIGAQDKEAAKALGQSPPPDADWPDDGRYFGLRPKLPSELADLLERMATASVDPGSASEPG